MWLSQEATDSLATASITPLKTLSPRNPCFFSEKFTLACEISKLGESRFLRTLG